MHILRIIGWGFVIYSAVQLAWRVLLSYGLAGTMTGMVFTLFVIVTASSIAASKTKSRTMADIIPHITGWILVAMLLDAFLYLPWNGPIMYTDISLWIGYFLIALSAYVTQSIRSMRGRVGGAPTIIGLT